MYTTRVSKYQTRIPKRAPWRTTLIAFLALFLAACGGGGGSVHSVPGAVIPVPDGETPRTGGGSVHSVPGAVIPVPDGETPRTDGGSTVQLTSEPTSGGDTPSARDSTPDAITRTDSDVITTTESLDYGSIADWIGLQVSMPVHSADKYKNKIHAGTVTFNMISNAIPVYPDREYAYTGEDRFFKGATYSGVVAGLEVDRNSVVTQHSGTMSLVFSDNATETPTFDATFSNNLPLDPMTGGTLRRTPTRVPPVSNPEFITYNGVQYEVAPSKPAWFLDFATKVEDNTEYVQFLSGRFYKEGDLAAGDIHKVVIESENKEDVNNVGFAGIFETRKQE